MDSPQEIAEYKAAKADLERISKRDGDVTDAVESAQQRVVAAEKGLSPWRRFFMN